MPQQNPVMLVEIEVRCKNCNHNDKIEVPVSCAVNMEMKDGNLSCSLVGEAKDYIKKCEECGSKKIEVTKQRIKKITFSGAGN